MRYLRSTRLKASDITCVVRCWVAGQAAGIGVASEAPLFDEVHMTCPFCVVS